MVAYRLSGQTDKIVTRYSVTLGSRDDQNHYTAELEAIAMALRCMPDGLQCRELTALSSSQSSQLRKYELTATRSTGEHWLRDHIIDNLAFQSWTLKDIKRAWLVAVTPAPAPTAQGSIRPLQPVPDAIRDFANQLYHMERGRLELQSTDQKPPPADNDASTPALLTNWMRRTGWDQTFESANCPILISLSTLLLPVTSPQVALYLGMHDGQALGSSAADEHWLLPIVAALDRLFDLCGETVRFTVVSVRRSLRSRFPDRPYKAPFELYPSHHRNGCIEKSSSVVSVFGCVSGDCR
jgi:hypothetical protein